MELKNSDWDVIDSIFDQMMKHVEPDSIAIKVEETEVVFVHTSGSTFSITREGFEQGPSRISLKVTSWLISNGLEKIAKKPVALQPLTEKAKTHLKDLTMNLSASAVAMTSAFQGLAAAVTGIRPDSPRPRPADSSMISAHSAAEFAAAFSEALAGRKPQLSREDDVLAEADAAELKNPVLRSTKENAMVDDAKKIRARRECQVKGHRMEGGRMECTRCGRAARDIAINREQCEMIDWAPPASSGFGVQIIRDVPGPDNAPPF